MDASNQGTINLNLASVYERTTAPRDHSGQMLNYMWSYLVVHGFLLADQLGAQDQHLLLADVQLLTGSVELLQEHLVSWGTRGPRTCSCVTQQALPHLCQVMLQLLVL